MTKKLGTYGQFGLHVIEYPSGKFGFVGSVPDVFCVEKPGTFGPELRSPVFETMEDATNYYEEKKHLINYPQ